MNCVFGGNLKLLRLTKGLSQAQLGKELYKGQKTIGNWETGYSEPCISDLICIGDFFQVTLDRLLRHNLRQADTALPSVQTHNETGIHYIENTQASIDDMKRLWMEELTRCSDTGDNIARRDAYITVLENKLYEETMNRIPQQMLQHTISNLKAIQKIVAELTDTAPEKSHEPSSV